MRAAAGGLRSLGLAPGECVALLSGTRLDWILADLATLGCAGVTTTIYPSSTAEDCAFIINDSQAVLVFAENDDQIRKLASKRSELPTVKHGTFILSKCRLQSSAFQYSS